MFNTHRAHSRTWLADLSPRRDFVLHRLATGDAAFVLLMGIAIGVLLIRALTGVHGDPITSDESLYLSEAVSIADGRIEYASGEPITHRPPLYPAMLAPVMALSGNSIDAARVIPIAVSIATLAAMYWLGRLTVGHRAACAGVVLAAFAAAPSRLASSFFVDTPAAMWLFASVAALIHAQRSPTRAAAWSALAALFLALSFLTKETAAMWLPLPVAFALFSDKRVALRPLVAFYSTFAAIVAPWFLWVAHHTGDGFKLDSAPLALILASLAPIVAGAFVFNRGWLDGRRTRTALRVIAIVGWALAMMLILESRPEPHSRDYLTNVPKWTVHVYAAGVEPWALIAAAWASAIWLACRHREGLQLLLTALCGAPLFLFVANQGWELRQVIWLVYLSYLVLGSAALHAIARVAGGWKPVERGTLAVTLVLVMGLIAGFASDAGSGAARDTARNWRTDEGREISRWLDELPNGATLLSSRLYSSQLYIDHGGRFHVRQLPTLGVTVTADGGFEPFGTLFRYEETELASNRHWISFEKYGGRPYAIGLAEQDLLDAITHHGATHLLLTGEDAGFSSLAYRGYFDENPAFRIIGSSHDSGAVLYAINVAVLSARRPPLVVGNDDFDYLVARVGDESHDPAFWRRVAPQGLLLGESLMHSAQLADRAKELLEPD